MKIICVVCELWLVEVFTNAGEVSYWCERCAHDTEIALSEHGDLRAFLLRRIGMLKASLQGQWSRNSPYPARRWEWH